MTNKSSEKFILPNSGSSRNTSSNMRNSFNNTVQINFGNILGHSKEREKGGVYDIATQLNSRNAVNSSKMH